MIYSFTKLINPALLEHEIRCSDITTSLEKIIYVPPYVEVRFKSGLSEGCVTVLNNIVDTHDHTKSLETETEALMTVDNRLIVKPNTRPLFTSGYFTSVDDDPTQPWDVGNGANQVKLDHKIGDPTTVTFEQSFCIELNRSWVFEGYITVIGARFDEFSYAVVAKKSDFEAAAEANTNYTSMGPLILPAAGDGELQPSLGGNILPVSVVPRTDTGIPPAGYWDFDYDSELGSYSAPIPAPTGTGNYNLFHTDYLLRRYINRYLLLGDHTIHFAAQDPAELGTNMTCRMTFETTAPDHEWAAAVNMSMFRTHVL